MELEIKILFILWVILFPGELLSQNCISSFTESITNEYNKEIKFEQKADRIIKREISDYSDNFRIIYIPVVFSSKKGAKLSENGRIDKENLLCLINSKTMDFDEALVIKDTLILGSVLKIPGAGYAFDNEKFRKNFIKPLVSEINSINPDIIFRIYNVPRCYWYIKNNELFVLSYDHKSRKMENFKRHNASEYIQESLMTDDLNFISNKRVIVIGR
jgi:hypothetical protein